MVFVLSSSEGVESLTRLDQTIVVVIVVSLVMLLLLVMFVVLMVLQPFLAWCYRTGLGPSAFLF